MGRMAALTMRCGHSNLLFASTRAVDAPARVLDTSNSTAFEREDQARLVPWMNAAVADAGDRAGSHRDPDSLRSEWQLHDVYPHTSADAASMKGAERVVPAASISESLAGPHPTAAGARNERGGPAPSASDFFPGTDPHITEIEADRAMIVEVGVASRRRLRASRQSRHCVGDGHPVNLFLPRASNADLQYNLAGGGMPAEYQSMSAQAAAEGVGPAEGFFSIPGCEKLDSVIDAATLVAGDAQALPPDVARLQ